MTLRRKGKTKNRVIEQLRCHICPNLAIEIAATLAKPHRRGVRQSPQGDFASVGAVSNFVAALTAGKSKCDIAKIGISPNPDKPEKLSPRRH
jgi:hypothetical protein